MAYYRLDLLTATELEKAQLGDMVFLRKNEPIFIKRQNGLMDMYMGDGVHMLSELLPVISETTLTEIKTATINAGESTIEAMNTAVAAAESATQSAQEAADSAENLLLLMIAPPISMLNKAVLLSTPTLFDLLNSHE